jgi:hypothetical protein
MGLNRNLEPAGMTALATTTSTRPQVGKRTELGRYTLPNGITRVVVGQRVQGTVRLVDVPLATSGRRYLIERELEQDGYAALQALVSDYLAVAKRRGVIPVVYNPLDDNDG